ncbi:MAG: hypothetical protein QXH32_01905 [Candidatus Caldarchaeum sp.]
MSSASSQSDSAPERLIDDSGASAAGPAVGDKGVGAEGVKRFYADIHRKKDDSGYRITYTTDGENFRHVDSPSEIPVGPGDKVFVDTIPIIHTDGFMELLRRGAEVYYLRRLSMIEAVRQRLNIKSKSAKSDIRVLMAIGDKWFRRVDEDFLIMRRMIAAFRSLLKTHQRLLNMSKAVSEMERRILREEIRFNEERMRKLAEIIAEEAERRYPYYKTIADILGIRDNHVMAREALAELLTYVDFSRGFMKLKRYLRLFDNKRYKQYNHETRHALTRLARAIHGTEQQGKQQQELLKTIWTTIRQETQKLAGIPAQQQG